MNDDRRPLPLAILVALLRASPLLLWGGGMLWWGMKVTPGPVDARHAIDAYSFHIFGALLLCVALVGVAIIVMRSQAPRKREDRIVESEELVFDPDAAIANYLASRPQAGSVESAQAAVRPPRPVFGRRGA